ncbi:MAG: DUF2269 family protein [Acidimicrobiia bacterium]
MNITDLALWLHIVAASAWLGGNLVQLMMPGLLASGGPPVMLAFGRASLVLGRIFFTPAAILTLLTGIWLVIDIGYSWGATFVSIGFAAVIVISVVSMGFLVPNGRRMVSAMESGDAGGARSLASRQTALGIVNVVVLLVTVLAMVAAWGA